MKIEVIKHKDVKGKELLYLKMSKGTKELIINIGQKTYDSVEELLKEVEQTELPLIGETVANLGTKTKK